MSKKEYPYKVSASIITYNQAEYIEKAVEGALKQEVDFPYEIIIGDDCSTDGTREILLDYKQKYPDLINLNLHDEHYDGIPGRLNNITNIRSAKGKYIAFCDGDDYWISKNKLQKQADFMDANPEYSFCFHDCIVYNELTSDEYHMSHRKAMLRKDGVFYLRDIVNNAAIPSSSTLYKKTTLLPLPDWFWNVYAADHFLQLLAARYGPSRYFKSLLYTRRIHDKNISDYRDSDLIFAKIKKTDTLYVNDHFSSLKYQPLRFEAVFYMHRAAKYFQRNQYHLMFLSVCKAISKDKRMVSRIIKKIISKVRMWVLKS